MVSKSDGSLQKSLDELSTHILQIEDTYKDLRRWHDLFKFCVEAVLEEPLTDEKTSDRLEILLDQNNSLIDCYGDIFYWEIKRAKEALGLKPDCEECDS